MTILSRAALLLGASLAVSTAWAQPTGQGVPNAVQGFSTNRDQPIQIEAMTLEVRDKDSIATFSGNVHVIQGDTHLRSKTLKVFYDQDPSKKDTGKQPARTASAGRPAQGATPGGGGQQQIRRLEARGDVVVIQNDQTATGDSGIFDVKSNSVTLEGNVEVSQGTNKLTGQRLIVNLETGVSRMESIGKEGQPRIRGTFLPAAPPPQNAAQPQQPAAAPAPQTGRQGSAPKQSQQPLRLN